MTIRKTGVLLAAAGMLIAAPAFAQSGSMQNDKMPNKMQSNPMQNTETQGAAPGGQAAISTQDFVTKAAISGMFEVESAKLAQQKDKQKQDQKFAKRMIKDHGKANDQLEAMVKGGKVEAQLPTALDSEHQQKLDELQKLSGREFDKAYDDANKAGHEDAVALFQNYSQNGDNPQLKQWAAKTLPTLKKHLSMVKKLQ